MIHLDKNSLFPSSSITIHGNRAAQPTLQMNRNDRMESRLAARQKLTHQSDSKPLLAGPRKRLKERPSSKYPADPSAPALYLDPNGDHFISTCPHHGIRVLISRPLTDQSSIYCSPSCIHQHVANIFPNWTSGPRSHLLINSATNLLVAFTGIKRQFEELIESNQMLKLFKYVKMGNRLAERKTTISVKGPKKLGKQLKCQNGESSSGKERIASTSRWTPLLFDERRKGDKQKSEKSSKKAKKRTHTGVPVNVGNSTASECESNSGIVSTALANQARSLPVTETLSTWSQDRVPPKLGTVSSSSSVDRPSLTEKLKTNFRKQSNQQTSSKPFRISLMTNDQSPPANKRQCPSQEPSVKTALVPAPQLVVPTIVWEGTFERSSGQTFPVVASPLTTNATSHWFQDSGFLTKETPVTKRLQMSKCTPLVEMFAFLRGDFQFAVVHFALSSKASSIDRSKAEETFHYLHEKKKAGACYRQKDGYLTNLFVYALGRADPLPELLQGVIALPGERSANMLLGLLVRKEPKPRQIRKPTEKETQARFETMRLPFEFPSNLPIGDSDERFQTSRRDPKMDPRLSASPAIAIQSLPQFQSQIQSPFRQSPSTSKAATVSRQEPPPVDKADQASLPIEPVNVPESDEEISLLNADAHAFFRQAPIGQRIPVLLNRRGEQHKYLLLSGKF